MRSSYRPPAAHLLALATLVVLATLVSTAATPASAQDQRFALEIAGGRAIGISPYREDVVVLESDFDRNGASIPYLVDEITGSGTLGRIHALFGSIEVGLVFATYDRSRIVLRERGDRELPDSRRRPDGSVDDTGVEYSTLPASRTERVIDPTRSSLLTYAVTAGYRFYLTSGLLNLYVPLGGGLTHAYIADLHGLDCPALFFLPGCIGLVAEAGLGLHIDLGERIDLIADARLGATGTFEPSYRGDGATNAYETDGSTADALFTALLSGMVGVGIHVQIR
jgi:hypothetical protein